MRLVATKVNAAPPRVSYDWEEYKIVQDKIDKIGVFSFQAKGWSITLVAGVLIAAKQAHLGLVAMAITVPLVVIFWGFDSREAAWREALILRAEQLEERLRTRTESFRAAPRGNAGDKVRAIRAQRERAATHSARALQGPAKGAKLRYRSIGHAMRHAGRNLPTLPKNVDSVFHFAQLLLSIAVPIAFSSQPSGVTPNAVDVKVIGGASVAIASPSAPALEIPSADAGVTIALFQLGLTSAA